VFTRLWLAEFRGNDLQYKINSACGKSAGSRRAYAKNVGWRPDYPLATPAFAALARSEDIYKEQRFSDHAPITVDYALSP
jgi:hypothetical protein